MNQETMAMYDLDNAVYNLLQAAKKVRSKWTMNQEFDEYPFADTLDIQIDKLQRWSDEVGGFYTELKLAEENAEKESSYKVQKFSPFTGRKK